MEPVKYEDIDQVIAYARSMPDFPDKSVVMDRLESRNLNRYQEALMLLNELVVREGDSAAGTDGHTVTKDQLQGLIDKIARMEAADNEAE